MKVSSTYHSKKDMGDCGRSSLTFMPFLASSDSLSRAAFFEYRPHTISQRATKRLDQASASSLTALPSLKHKLETYRPSPPLTQNWQQGGGKTL
ncbi:hypothetical protein V6N11_043397 [Hibiscus sabdariffa]|uniref:Uncharacterized protein n=1 Tax=Hibiscus sabdariffa TaxID=183260 RepID=A0ABR2RC26_9ROSI